MVLIQNLPVKYDNFNFARNLIIHCYNNTNLIATCYIKQLFQIPQSQEEKLLNSMH